MLRSQDYPSSDEDDLWLAQLAVTEQQINHLQDEVDFKREELEAAAIQNETVAERVSAIRSSLLLLRQNRISGRSSGVARMTT